MPWVKITHAVGRLHHRYRVEVGQSACRSTSRGGARWTPRLPSSPASTVQSGTAIRANPRACQEGAKVTSKTKAARAHPPAIASSKPDQPREPAEEQVLDQQDLPDLAAAGSQGAQQGALPQALEAAAGDHRGEHRETGGDTEQGDEAHHHGDLGQHLVDGDQDQVEVDDRHVGKVADRPPLQPGAGFGVAGAGDENVELRRLLEDPGGKQDEEIRHDALPLDLPQAADDDLDRHPLHVEEHPVPDRDVERLRQPALERDEDGVRGRPPPLPGDDRLGPGEWYRGR